MRNLVDGRFFPLPRDIIMVVCLVAAAASTNVHALAEPPLSADKTGFDLNGLCQLPVFEESVALLDFLPDRLTLPPGSFMSFNQFMNSANKLGVSAFVIRIPPSVDPNERALQEKRLLEIRAMIKASSLILNAPIYFENVYPVSDFRYEHTPVPVVAERLRDHYQILPINFGRLFISKHIFTCLKNYINFCAESTSQVDHGQCDEAAAQLLTHLKPAY